MLQLVIFVSAAAVIIVAAIWRPWSSDNTSASQAIQPQPTASANTVVQVPAATPDAGGPTGP